MNALIGSPWYIAVLPVTVYHVMARHHSTVLSSLVSTCLALAPLVVQLLAWAIHWCQTSSKFRSCQVFKKTRFTYVHNHQHALDLNMKPTLAYCLCILYWQLLCVCMCFRASLRTKHWFVWLRKYLCAQHTSSCDYGCIFAHNTLVHVITDASLRTTHWFMWLRM